MQRLTLPSDRTRSRLTTLLGLTISVVSIVAVVAWASGQEAPRIPSTGGEIAALLGAIGVYGGATAIRSERWLALLRHAGGSPPRADAYGLTLVGFMGNNTLPARGGDLLRIYLMPARASLRIRDVIGTLIAERVLDAGLLLSFFVILAYGVLRGADAPEAEYLVLGLAAVALVGVAIGLIAYLGRENSFVRRAIEFAQPMLEATIRLRGWHGLRMLGLTAASWVAEALTYLLVAKSVGLTIDPIEALYVITIASVFVLVPSGPAYAGTLDAAVIFGVKAIGATGSQAVSMLISLRFVLMVPITLAGLVVLVIRYGWAPRRRARAT